jgi:hypothetical protein
MCLAKQIMCRGALVFWFDTIAGYFPEGLACAMQNQFSQHVFAFSSTALGLIFTFMDLHIEHSSCSTLPFKLPVVSGSQSCANSLLNLPA